MYMKSFCLWTGMIILGCLMQLLPTTIFSCCTGGWAAQQAAPGQLQFTLLCFQVTWNQHWAVNSVFRKCLLGSSGIYAAGQLGICVVTWLAVPM